MHRAGRTARAGQTGTAITFLDPINEEKYAPDMVRALKEISQDVPEDLLRLTDVWFKQRQACIVRGHSSGYGGSECFCQLKMVVMESNVHVKF